MVEVWLPYNKTEVVVKVPNENFLGIIDGKEVKGAENPEELIRHSINNPSNGMKLEEIVKSGDKVAIVIDDETRPLPSHLIISCLVNKLNQSGIEDDSITIIVGTGMHSSSLEKMREIIGEEYLKRVNVVIHDCNSKDLVYFGKTSFGTEVYINKFFATANVRIVTGDIDLHYFAGYGGGRKSVLPAISGIKTIQQNHKLLFNPKARTGNLDGNIIHKDMEEAANLVGVNFAVNVVLNPQKEVIQSFAGDMKQTFLQGVKLVDEIYKVHVGDRASIIIVSPGGHPYDIDLYQSYKGLDSVLTIVKDDGIIILVAECTQGYGNEVFYEWMVKYKTLVKLERELKRKFVLGAHKAYYFLKALQKVQIILVSAMPNYYSTNIFKLQTAKSVNAALRAALKMKGKKSKILVVPHAATIFPRIQNKEER
jgi:nickel-dependent lactate racemase